MGLFDYVSGLFTGSQTVVNPSDSTPAGLGIFEPVVGWQDTLDWDPSEPFTDRPGNQGCPPGYYTSYDSGGKVCKRYSYSGNKLVGYDAGASAASATSFAGSITQAIAKVTDVIAAPVKQAKSWIDAVPWLKGSYTIVALLIAAAVFLLMLNRTLSRAEGR